MSAAAGTAARRFRNAKDFNAPDADLVIRSSVLDAANIGVNFKVNIAKLATSPVFRDMAEISGPDAQTADAASGGLPVLYLDEDAFTVCNLLKLIYNGEKGFPDFPKATEADMSNLYAACWKYDLPVARLAVEQALLLVLAQYPVKTTLQLYTHALRGSCAAFRDACIDAIARFAPDKWDADILENLSAMEIMPIVKTRDAHSVCTLPDPALWSFPTWRGGSTFRGYAGSRPYPGFGMGGRGSGVPDDNNVFGPF